MTTTIRTEAPPRLALVARLRAELAHDPEAFCQRRLAITSRRLARALRGAR